MRGIVDMSDEPRGETLHGLLRWLAAHSSRVSIVLRKGVGLAPGGDALLARLQPHLVAQTESSSWPGTTLLDGVATVFHFGPIEAVLETLLGAAGGLYDWQQPRLPEDLAFLRSDGTAILTSISHERDGYLEITPDEYANLIASVPDLVRLLRAQERGA